MADVSHALVTHLLATSAITDVVSSRIEPHSLTQTIAVPAITYRRISTNHFHSILGADVGVAWTRMEFWSIAATQTQADALAELIRLSGLLAWRGTTVGGVRFQGTRIDSGIRQVEFPPDPGNHERRYAAVQDYQFFFDEEV